MSYIYQQNIPSDSLKMDGKLRGNCWKDQTFFNNCDFLFYSMFLWFLLIVFNINFPINYSLTILLLLQLLFDGSTFYLNIHWLENLWQSWMKSKRGRSIQYESYTSWVNSKRANNSKLHFTRKIPQIYFIFLLLFFTILFK